jgi:PilZ domain-containing protein
MGERRTSRRIPVTFRARFAPVSVGTNEGTIVDLAPGGCRVESPIIVPVNTYLELRLEVSLQDPPILVDLAAVRWIRGGHLGVEFLSLRPEHQARLLRIVDQAH